MHCLQQSVLVQRGAIAVLSRMYQDDLLTNIFEPVQLAALSNTVLQLSTIHDEMLDRELEGLSGFF